MFISRLLLNPCNAQVRSELARPYEMHRTLLRAFPKGSVGIERDKDASAGILFRVDENPRDNSISVLVQSKDKFPPDWSFLIGQKDVRGHDYLISSSNIPDRKPNLAITEFNIAKKLTAGQTLAFRLRANPTKRLGKDAGKDQGKRVGIYKEDEQLKWLHEKLEGDRNSQHVAGGFHLLRCQISRDEKIENSKAIVRGSESHDLKLFSVQFDGILRVVDPIKAANTISTGIGSAKGFGFGLLSIAPVRD